MSDRFDLEQEILECWRVVSDIKLWVEKGAEPQAYVHLAEYYEHKFDKLWATFETMCAERQFVNTNVESGPVL